jgi:hypothetical protein
MTRHALITRNAALDAVTALCDGGFLRFYSGSQPDNPEAAAGAHLCELRLSSKSFARADMGAATANPIRSDDFAARSGSAGWFRIFKADGKTPVLDGKISTSGADININNTEIQAGAIVECAALKITINS